MGISFASGESNIWYDDKGHFDVIFHKKRWKFEDFWFFYFFLYFFVFFMFALLRLFL